MFSRSMRLAVAALALTATSMAVTPAAVASTGSFVPPPKCIPKDQYSGDRVWQYEYVQETQYPFRTLVFHYWYGTIDAQGTCTQNISSNP